MADKIKIVYVETNCKKTGPIQQTLNIIKYMDRTRFSPCLITIWPEEDGNTMLDEYKKEEIPVFCCSLNKVQSIFAGKMRVTELLRQIKPDIVQGVGMPPYRMTLGYGKAVHFTTLRNYCYEDYPDRYSKGIGNILAFLDIQLIKKQIQRGEPFVTCSESLTNIYREKEKLSIPFIRNGVDVNKYKRRSAGEKESLRKQLGLPQDRFVFVYSGGLIGRKNQKEAIEGFLAMRNKKRTLMLLLGDGKDRQDLEEKYAGDDIIFKGKVSNVRDYLAASDAYISTSKSEGLPNGVLEAMSVGLPLILSDIPQHMELLNTGSPCGASYKLGDSMQLSRIMESYTEGNLDELRDNSADNVSNYFTAEKVSSIYQERYLETVNQARMRSNR